MTFEVLCAPQVPRQRKDRTKAARLTIGGKLAWDQSLQTVFAFPNIAKFFQPKFQAKQDSSSLLLFLLCFCKVLLGKFAFAKKVKHGNPASDSYDFIIPG